MEPDIFLDTNVIFYCTGNIGYLWAVKVMEYIARNPGKVATDTLFFQEILDRFAFLGERGRAELIFRNARKLLQVPLEVTLADFDRSYSLSRKYPMVSPRALLRIAVMLNNGLEKICATYSSELEAVDEIVRINLMDRNLENENTG